MGAAAATTATLSNNDHTHVLCFFPPARQQVLLGLQHALSLCHGAAAAVQRTLKLAGKRPRLRGKDTLEWC